MSNRYPIDDLFRDRFEQYEPKLPEQAWNALQAAQEKRKRRPFFWWISGAVLLVGLIIGLTWDNHPRSANLAQTNEQSKEKVNSPTPAAAFDNTNPTNTTSTHKLNESTSTSSMSNSVADREKETPIRNSPPQLISKRKKNPLFTLPKNNIADEVRQDEDQDRDLAQTERSIQRKSKHIGSAGMTIQTSSMGHTEDNGNGSALSENNVTDLSTSELLKQRNQQIFAHRLTRTQLQSSTEIKSMAYPRCPNLEREAAANKTYIEWYTGPDIGIKSYQDTGTSSYLQKRRESTDFRWAFSAGFRYTRVFQNGMSFRTGINFTQITERFRWVKANYVQVNYAIDPLTGDTTGITSVRGTRYKTTYNRFRSIDVPLILGYETGFGKFKLNAYAGGMLNLYSWQRGEVLDTALRPISITTGKAESLYQYRNNMGLGLTGGVSLYYRIHDNWQVMAEPYFRYNLTPMNRDGLTLRERYSLIGLRIGIRRDLW